MEESLKRTPLYDTHLRYGAKIVPFSGWEMPVQYKAGVIKEHMAVRQACGVFDVSHMGEVLCKGPGALPYLNYLLTNDFTGLAAGQARYSPMCNENGGIVDDLIVYKKSDEEYLIVINAGNIDKDYQWMLAHQTENVELENLSDRMAQIAVQGPATREVLARIMDPADIPEKNYRCHFDRRIAGFNCMVSTTGYTGEDGVEIGLDPAEAPELWDAILEAGKDLGALPCGLGARDTLRLEAGMPLYGHEMTDDITPVEAGLDFFVKMQKDDFIGKKALEEKGEPQKRRVGLIATGRGILREEMDIYSDGKKVGFTTSGTKAPFLNRAVAMGYVDTSVFEMGGEVEVDVRGRMVSAEIVPHKFYKRTK